VGILLTIAYDGTAYSGWQIQRNALSVQEVLDDAVARQLSSTATLLGASRTDAGVHALGQRVHVIADNITIPVHKIPLVLNANLPEDIRVMAAERVDDSFHPINDAVSKIYTYSICNARVRNPLVRRHTAFVPLPLDVDKMAEAAIHFIGRHDFAAFCASGSSVKSTVRSLFDVSVGTAVTGSMNGRTVDITLHGDGFLYNMVRIIAGTLVDVGCGKLQPHDVPDIIASRERSRAGKTMPPEGLTLVEIIYNIGGN